jgi:hypothetical protein
VLCSTRAVDEQSRDTSHDGTKREILGHLLVGAKARGKEADDLDGRVRMVPQTIEQLTLWNEDDDAFGNRYRVRRLRLIVEHRDVAEGASRTEHFQHLLAALQRGRQGAHAAAENDAESFGLVALSENHIAGFIRVFP